MGAVRPGRHLFEEILLTSGGRRHCKSPSRAALCLVTPLIIQRFAKLNFIMFNIIPLRRCQCRNVLARFEQVKITFLAFLLWKRNLKKICWQPWQVTTWQKGYEQKTFFFWLQRKSWGSLEGESFQGFLLL